MNEAGTPRLDFHRTCPPKLGPAVGSPPTVPGRRRYGQVLGGGGGGKAGNRIDRQNGAGSDRRCFACDGLVYLNDSLPPEVPGNGEYPVRSVWRRWAFLDKCLTRRRVHVGKWEHARVCIACACVVRCGESTSESGRAGWKAWKGKKRSGPHSELSEFQTGFAWSYFATTIE